MIENKIEIYLQEKFQKEGFISISLDKLSRELKISKKTVYKEYKSKKEIIDTILTKMLSEAYYKVIKIVSEESPFIVKFHSIFEIIKVNLRAFDDESLLRLKEVYPEIWIKIARFRKYHIIPLIRLLIKSGIKKGVLNEYPIELYLKFLFGTLKGITSRDNKLIEKDLDILLNMVLEGALTKKGRKFLNHKLVNVN